MEFQVIISNNEEIYELQEWIEESQLNSLKTKLEINYINEIDSKRGMGIGPNAIVEIIVAIGGTATAAAFVNGIFNTLKSWIEYKSRSEETAVRIQEIKSKENEVILKKGDYEISFNMNNIEKIDALKQSFLNEIESEIKTTEEKKKG